MSRLQPNYNLDSQSYLGILLELSRWSSWQETKFHQLQKAFPKSDKEVTSKTELLAALQQFQPQLKFSETTFSQLQQWLQVKPTRTVSGVAPVTVLTKPFPCPGKCIFCPSDVRMPKSYLSSEPGAQRAEKNYFDPYLQTHSRLKALRDMGHPTDKIELIILGGTWSFYPESYQKWFIFECFRAMNEFGHQDESQDRRSLYQQAVQQLQQHQHLALTDDPKVNASNLESRRITAADAPYNLVVSQLYIAPEKQLGLDAWQTATWEEISQAHLTNETADSRCVGLVIETRPDHISEAEVMKIRRFGCTKTQIGVQSLQDEVLEKNHRGHNVAATAKAFKLLRQAGFKIHAHWMPNLYGSDVAKDIADYYKLFHDPDFKPDELKIYPCSLIDSAELMKYYQDGKWRPYTEPELLEVLSECFRETPLYCRLTRVIRDIPSDGIVVGNKKTNFRQVVRDKPHLAQTVTQDIRSREIRGQQFDVDTLKLSVVSYQTSVSTEHFLQFTAMPVVAAVATSAAAKAARGQSNNKTPVSEKLLGFLRLSLPTQPSFIPELNQSTTALIREVHVYGQVSSIGQKSPDKVQHLGLGTKLIQEAKKLSLEAGYHNLAVISAIGTKEYYRSRGFVDGQLYQHLRLR